MLLFLPIILAPDPLIEYIDDTLANFTDDLIGNLNSTCDESSGATNRRFLQETNSANATLVEQVRDAIDSVNSALNNAGITIDGSVEPYFDGANSLLVSIPPSLSSL